MVEKAFLMWSFKYKIGISQDFYGFKILPRQIYTTIYRFIVFAECGLLAHFFWQPQLFPFTTE